MTDTTNHCPQCDQMARRIEELEAACAVMDEALRTFVNRFGCHACSNGKQSDEGCEGCEIPIFEAALASTPPSGMRVVSVEDLLSQHDRWQQGCPSNMPAASYYCSMMDEVLQWLAALIGGEDA